MWAGEATKAMEAYSAMKLSEHFQNPRAKEKDGSDYKWIHELNELAITHQRIIS